MTPQTFWNGSAYTYFTGMEYPVVEISNAGEARTILASLDVSNVAERPRLAFDGSRYLVVWTDANHDGGFGNILGMFLGLNGSPLSAAFSICAEPGYQLVEDVAWDGENFHVVWSDGRDRSFRVYHSMVLPTGKVQPQRGEYVFQDLRADLGLVPASPVRRAGVPSFQFFPTSRCPGFSSTGPASASAPDRSVRMGLNWWERRRRSPDQRTDFGWAGFRLIKGFTLRGSVWT